MMSSLGTLVVIQRVGARIKELGTAVVESVFSNAFTLYIGLNMVAGVLLVFFPRLFFDLLLDSKGEVSYMMLVAIIVVLNAFSQIPLYLIQGLGEFRLFSLRNLASTLIVLLVTAAFVFIMDNNLLGAFYGLVFSYFLNALLTGLVFFRVIRKFGISIQLTLNRKILKEVLSDGFIYYFGNTFLVAIVGLVIISLFFNHLTSYEYGFTRIGNAFAVILSIVPAAIQPVTISMLSVHHERNEYIKSLQLRIIPFMSTLMLLLVSFNLELMLGLMFGNNYKGARDIVFGMILVQIPYIYQGLINNYQIGKGNLNFVGWVAIVGCLSMIGFSFYLVPLYGVKGYFGAMYISTFFGLSMLAHKEFYKKGKLHKHDWNSILLNLALIGVAYLGMYFLPDIWRIPATILVLIGAGILFWNLSIETEEKEFLLSQKSRLLSLAVKTNKS